MKIARVILLVYVIFGICCFNEFSPLLAWKTYQDTVGDFIDHLNSQIFGFLFLLWLSSAAYLGAWAEAQTQIEKKFIPAS